MAAAPLQHRRVERPRHQHRRLEVDPQRPHDLLGAEIRQQTGARQPGVGDEDVDLARLGREPLGGAGLGQVGRQRPVPIAGQLGRQGFKSLGVTAAEDQLGVLCRQRLDDRPAQSPGGTGEQRFAAGKFHPRPQASTRPAERNSG
jgi:hypothetical protein